MSPSSRVSLGDRCEVRLGRSHSGELGSGTFFEHRRGWGEVESDGRRHARGHDLGRGPSGGLLDVVNSGGEQRGEEGHYVCGFINPEACVLTSLLGVRYYPRLNSV